jgi:ABC-2 type transport system ATP-binding protein
MSASGAILDIRSVRKTYDAGRRRDRRVALDDVSLEVTAGQWVALLGPNGSGKSTLLRLLGGVQAPDEGVVRIFGEHTLPLTGASRRRLGVVFQSPGLDVLLTVRENLTTQGALLGLSRRDIAQRIDQLAALLQITDRLEDRVGRLSGGLARRVDLARALLGRPDLLLLDEPLTGLDVRARTSFLDTLGSLRDDHPDLTILMATHLLDGAARADVVVLMDEGEVAAVGEPVQLRQAMGGRVLQTSLEHRDRLASLGLSVREVGTDAVCSGDMELLGHAAAELLRDGIDFQVHAPTLADVYLAHTGRALGGDSA